MVWEDRWIKHCFKNCISQSTEWHSLSTTRRREKQRKHSSKLIASLVQMTTAMLQHYSSTQKQKLKNWKKYCSMRSVWEPNSEQCIVKMLKFLEHFYVQSFSSILLTHPFPLYIYHGNSCAVQYYYLLNKTSFRD